MPKSTANFQIQDIKTLETAVQRAKLGHTEKNEAIKNLSKAAAQLEKDFTPNDNFQQLIERERRDSWKYGGRTVFGKAQPPKKKPVQPRLEQQVAELALRTKIKSRVVLCVYKTSSILSDLPPSYVTTWSYTTIS